MLASNSTRSHLTKAFLALDEGKHLQYDFVKTIPITAFRIVPKGTEGNMMVDGEKVPYGRKQKTFS